MKMKTNACGEFIKLFKPHWFILLLAAIVSVILAAMKFVIPISVMYCIDSLDTTQAIDYYIKLIGGISILLTIGYLFQIWLAYLVNIFKERVFYKIQQQLFSHIHNLPMSYFNKTETGYLIARLRNDVYASGGVLADKWIMLTLQVFIFFIAVGLCFWVDLKLTLIALGTLPFFFLAFFLPAKKLRRMGNDIQERNADVLKDVEESLKNVYTTKLLGRQSWRLLKLMHALKNEIVTKIRFVIFSSSVNNVSDYISNVGTVALLGVGIYMVTDGSIQLGRVIGLLSFYGYMFTSLGQMVTFNVAFQRSMASVKRIYGMLNLTPEKTASLDTYKAALKAGDSTENAIELSHVFFSYDRKKIDLIDISFKIRRGEIFALLGKSGSGKSTIAHLLTGLYSPKKGCISIDGVDIKKIPLHTLRKKVGLVPHNPATYNGSILENILLGDTSFSMEDVYEASRLAMAHDFISSFPQGYDTQVGEGGLSLSIGEKQRIVIARVLLRKPEILIIDEGTSGIDSVTEKKIMKALACLYRERYLMIISHRLFSMQLAESITLLENGRVVKCGTPVEIHTDERYQELFQGQYLGGPH